MPSDPAGYLVGRESIRFPDGNGLAVDKMIAAQRLDGMKLRERRFHHCTFSNVSFKDAEITDSEFNDCAFVNCYFRKTRVTNCRFVGSKFYTCEFPKVAVQSCDFRYALFFSCAVPFEEMEHNMPSEPNLREELAAGVAVAADERGWSAQARAYRLAAISAREEHLLSAIQCKSTWYQDHYPPLRRLGAFFQLIMSKANGLLWGYGERWSVLLRNLVFLAIGVFPGLLWIFRQDLFDTEGNHASFVDIMWLSLSTIVPVNTVSFITASGSAVRIILTTEAFCGIVIAGLFITLVLRSVLNR